MAWLSASIGSSPPRLALKANSLRCARAMRNLSRLKGYGYSAKFHFSKDLDIF